MKEKLYTSALLAINNAIATSSTALEETKALNYEYGLGAFHQCATLLQDIDLDLFVKLMEETNDIRETMMKEIDCIIYHKR